MKKLFLITIMLGAFLTTNAQKKKTTTSSSKSSSSKSSSKASSSGMGYGSGDLFITGTLGYTDDGNDSSEFAIRPAVGYMLSDNFALGGTLGYESAKTAGSDAVDAFLVGAIARYYFTPSSQFSIFGQGELIAKFPEKATEINFLLSPNVSYFLSDHFALEAGFGGVGVTNTSVDGGDSNTSFEFGLDLRNVNIGLTYKF
jgi:hypothetical protein